MDENMMQKIATMYKDIVEEWGRMEDLNTSISQLSALTRAS
jgi:hypothetical protein